jgi:hypothetical protein|eukprot:COSAG06_NODE_492_length_15074_cov_26.658564_8_plen_57_part_00
MPTYNGIQGHLEDSPPDHHRPIPKSLTASFVQAGETAAVLCFFPPAFLMFVPSLSW